MKERNPGRLLLSFGLTVLALIGASTFPLSSASATTIVAQHSGQCMDVVGGGTADGIAIEQRTCSGLSRQNWTLQDAGSGTFLIKNQNSSKCIQKIATSTGLEQSTCNAATTGQLWTRQPTTTLDVYAFKHQDTGKCIDVPAASQTPGALPTVFTCAEKAHQSFAIAPTEYPSPPLPLVAVHSGRCLDITGGPQATGEHAPIEQWLCTGATSPTTNQIWNFQDAGNGTVRLIAQNTFATASPKCVQPQGGVVTNSTPLETLACDSNSAVQKWVRENHDTNQYSFRLDGTSSCIDIAQSGLANGAIALLFTCKGTANQSWMVGTPPLPPNPSVEVLSGEYWQLPSNYPQKSPYGGLNQIWGSPVRTPYSPVTDLHWVGGFWKNLNPADDVYDWPKLEVNGSLSGAYNLTELKNAGKSALIWTALGNVDGTQAGNFHTPEWVRTKCAALGQPVTVINEQPHVDGHPDAPPWGLALWEPCPRTEVLQFIRGMFSKYRTDPQWAPVVKYAYASTLNAGEFWIPSGAYRDAKNKGLTPAILQSYANDIIDAWIDALGVKKVIWTSAGGWKLPDDPNASANGSVETEAVDERALITLGTQLREGNSENVLAEVKQPRINQNIVDVAPRPSYAQTNESHWYFTPAPTIQEMGASGMSFYGTEFEIANLAGAFDDYPYYRQAVLNMVRKGFNYAIFPSVLRTRDNDAAHPDFAALRDYFRQTAGYPRSAAPEASVVLQMFHDSCFNGRQRYHNYERFLLQREYESDGHTVPVDGITWPSPHYGFCSLDQPATVPAESFFARRTDTATGSNSMYFDIDSAFAATSERRFKIAVTYHDVGTAVWKLQYSTATVNQKDTPTVTNSNSNAIKTAIFTLPDASFRGAFGVDASHPMDFRIFNSSSVDLTVRNVRVIRVR